MSSKPDSSSSQEILGAYLDDAMGVRFEALSKFAEPLFELYALDVRCSPAQRLQTCPPRELRTFLTALDTARLFWAYFSLEDAEQEKYRPALKHCLIGANPPGEAEASFQALTEVMRDRWDNMSETMREQACDAAPAALPPFPQLLEQHGAPPQDTAAGAATYGPKQLEQAEALALFAQPLFDDPALHADPDALEARMALATAYWDLAHVAPASRPKKMQRLLQRFADSPDDRERLQREAQAMLKRFARLFPERAD